MNAPDGRLVVEIGERARHLEDAVIAASRKLHLLRRIPQQLQTGGIRLGDGFDHRGRAAGIGDDPLHAGALETLSLPLPGASNTQRNIGALFRRRRPDQIGGGNGGHVDANIDAIKQGAGNASLIIAHAARPAGAGVARFAGHAASARVHRRDELDGGGVGNAMVRAGNDAFAGLQRLAQCIERLRRELRQLIEKENAVMGERGLAGLGAKTTADERCHGGGMMRRAIGPPVGELAARKLACDGMDHRHFEQFRRRQWR